MVVLMSFVVVLVVVFGGDARGGWCWFLVIMLVVSGFWWGLMVVFVVVNGSFGGDGFCGGACGGEWWLCFLWFLFYEFVVDGVFKYMDVRRCGLFKVRLHGFLVGLMVILEGFSTVWHKICLRAFRLWFLEMTFWFGVFTGFEGPQWRVFLVCL